MTMTPVYLLTTSGNPDIKISEDELRSPKEQCQKQSLLGEIEAELHQSIAYRDALASLQDLLGFSSEQLNSLLKAVGREAISLAFQRFIQHEETVANIKQQVDITVSPSLEQEKSSSVASDKLHLNPTSVNISQENLPLESQVLANIPQDSINELKNRTSATLIKWLKPKKQPSTTTEIPKQIVVAEQRLETMRKIGAKLRQARESQRISLRQLNIYTHLSIYQMEAIENGKLDLLPEDIFVRGFIRVMANALKLDGTALAASLPVPEKVKSVLPARYQSQNTSKGLDLTIKPMHLYVSYTALVAGAMGGLTLVSQQVHSDKTLNSDVVTLPSSTISQSPDKTNVTAKPGIKSSSAGISVGRDIAPPESL
jgi:hypothetical protein